MGLMTFDLSDYTAAPEHSILTLTYLGYAGADKTATATDKVKVGRVDTSRCTGTAPCDTNNATWANRPDFEVTDTTKTATSHAFAYGSKKYSDGMTVESGNAKKVLLDVTDIIKAEFAKFSAGATEKKITLAPGRAQQVRHAFRQQGSHLADRRHRGHAADLVRHQEAEGIHAEHRRPDQGQVPEGRGVRQGRTRGQGHQHG